MFNMKRGKKAKAPNLDKIKPGDPIEAHNGARYTVDNVVTDGNGVLHSMTLQRETPKRDKSMSPRQARNKRKAERRLERDRKARRLEAALRSDIGLAIDEAADDADVVDMPRVGQ